MAHAQGLLHVRGNTTATHDWRANATPEDFVVESWSEGFMVGALLIMSCITIANMRRGVLLHKLILAEQVMATMQGTFCFMSWSGYGWYISATAALLYISWFVHNIVAWIKVWPFFKSQAIVGARFSSLAKWIYLSTLAMSIGPITLQIIDNFLFFNNINDRYQRVRPYETLMRDPWWVFTCLFLFWVMQKCYGTDTIELIKRSPRFGILIISILLAMIFTIVDIVASVVTISGTTDGINPWWKLSLVFKCLTDTIMLDDLKSELQRLCTKLGLQQAPRIPPSATATTNTRIVSGGDVTWKKRFAHFEPSTPTTSHSVLSDELRLINKNVSKQENLEPSVKRDTATSVHYLTYEVNKGVS